MMKILNFLRLGGSSCVKLLKQLQYFIIRLFNYIIKFIYIKYITKQKITKKIEEAIKKVITSSSISINLIKASIRNKKYKKVQKTP